MVYNNTAKTLILKFVNKNSDKPSLPNIVNNALARKSYLPILTARVRRSEINLLFSNAVEVLFAAQNDLAANQGWGGVDTIIQFIG